MAITGVPEQECISEPVSGSESSLRLFLDELPVKLAMASSDGRVEYLNRAARDAIGVDLETLRARGWESVVSPYQAGTIMDRWRTAVREGEPFTADHQYLCSDGKYRWWRTRAQPVKDGVGAVVRWYAAFTDISGPSHLGVAAGGERHYQEILDAIPTIVWCADKDGQLIYTNRATVEFSGITVEQLAEENFILVHPDEVPQVSSTWWHSLSTGEPYHIECRMRSGDGVYKWFLVRANPVRDDAGHVIRWFGSCADIDEQKKLEAEAREARRRFEQAARIATVAELSASIAHEITQPLTAIVSNGHACQRWLSMDPPNIDRARATADWIVRHGMSAADIVQRIRSLFKRAAPAMAPLDINGVIGEVLEVIKQPAERADISVKAELAADLQPARADRVQIQQVISNLAQNAFDALSEIVGRPKQLIIRSRSADGQSIVVEVSDNGSGLEFPDRVFESFFTTKAGGMGMGLAICRSIVKAHGGRLWANSNPDHGTTFSFCLPETGAG